MWKDGGGRGILTLLLYATLCYNKDNNYMLLSVLYKRKSGMKKKNSLKKVGILVVIGVLAVGGMGYWGTNGMLSKKPDFCDGMTCPEGTACLNGVCLCPTGQEVCGTICCPAEQMCLNDVKEQCVDVAGNCKSNKDCEEGKYCQIQVSQLPIGVAPVFVGHYRRCVPLGDEYRIEVKGQGTMIGSKDAMNWWSARSWCQAHGKRLIRANSLNCTNGVGQSKKWGYCCGEEQGGCDGVKGEPSIVMQALRDAYAVDKIPNWIWTSTIDDSKILSIVILNPGFVGPFLFSDVYGNAVCE